MSLSKIVTIPSWEGVRGFHFPAKDSKKFIHCEYTVTILNSESVNGIPREYLINGMHYITSSDDNSMLVNVVARGVSREAIVEEFDLGGAIFETDDGFSLYKCLGRVIVIDPSNNFFIVNPDEVKKFLKDFYGYSSIRDVCNFINEFYHIASNPIDHVYECYHCGGTDTCDHEFNSHEDDYRILDVKYECENCGKLNYVKLETKVIKCG